MEVDRHVDALEREGRSLVESARRADPDARVPACPAWRIADLLAHVGFVHRWATRYVATALTEAVEEPGEETILQAAPPVAERCDWVAEGHGALVSALRSAPSDLVCWTFLEAPSPLAMWARRQAHETAVHRADAELAAAALTPVEPELAVDGIDELLFCFFSRPPRRAMALPGGELTFGLDATDRAERWSIRVSERGVEAEKGHGERDVDVDVDVRGTASDLYLLLWHRRPLEGLDVVGPARRFEEVWGPRGVTWS